MISSKRKTDNRGFTLVELVLVIVLVGILAAAAAPRFFNLSLFSERGFFDAALSTTRFAQKLAIATGCNVRIQFSSTGYVVTWNRANCQDFVNFPDVAPHPTGGGEAKDSAPNGVSVSSDSVIFDAAGRPRSAGGGFIGSVVDVSVGSRTLRIEPQSGYAHRP